jgi:hypothetical protein
LDGGAALGDSVATADSLLMSAAAARGAGVNSRAAMTMTAPVTHIAASSIVPAPTDHVGVLDFFLERAPVAGDFFVAVVFERVDFFSGIDRPPSKPASSGH